MLSFIIIISASKTCDLLCPSNKSLSYQWVASILGKFWMILSPNKHWSKIFFLSCPKHCDRGLIVVMAYPFRFWNKKEHKIIVSRVISSQIGPMYIKTRYTSYNTLATQWLHFLVALHSTLQIPVPSNNTL